MPFDNTIKTSILTSCDRDLPNDEWYDDAFCFVKNRNLKNRLISEFKNARFVYKIFEELSAKDELLVAEVRMQILMYASIYDIIKQKY